MGIALLHRIFGGDLMTDEQEVKNTGTYSVNKGKVIGLSLLSIVPLMLTFGAINNWFQDQGTGAHAEVYDSLFQTYWWLGTIIAIAVYGYFVWLISTSVDAVPSDAPQMGQTPEIRGSNKVAWTITVAITALLLILSSITFSSIDFFEDVNANSTDDTFTVLVTGYQYYWTYEYPNGEILTSAAEEPLRIPVGVPVIFEVTSGDVFHSFALPEHRIKADAIPGRTISIWIDADETGSYPIRCFELCGDDHALMVGELLVMEKEEFETWHSGGV